jgi:hypothetical protein
MTEDWMIKMRTAKRGLRIESWHPLGSRQVLAISHCWTERPAGNYRIPLCRYRGDEFRDHDFLVAGDGFEPPTSGV